MSLESIRGAILVLMLLAATPIRAEDNQIVGVASVDGDTVEILWPAYSAFRHRRADLRKIVACGMDVRRA